MAPIGSMPGDANSLPGAVLMLAANPTDLARLALADEYKLLQDRLRGRGADKLRHLPEARLDELVRILLDQRDVQLVHFSGHGNAMGQLLFEDREHRSAPADEEAFASVFAEFEHIECVFLNACHSTRQAALIGAHVEWVVGMADEIEDSAAIEFSALFYVALANGKPIDAAFRIALAGTRLSEPGRASVPTLYHRGAPHLHSRPLGQVLAGTLDHVSAIEAEIARRSLLGEDTSEFGERLLAMRRSLRSGPSLAPGQVLEGRYELGEPAGRGGFATVWKAWDRTSKQLVAVKVLHGQWAEDRSHRERFESGTRRMSVLDHPAIIRVLAHPTRAQGHYFYVLPWYEGGDLRVATISARIDRNTGLRAISQVLDGLEHAHARGVVHRDIKPSNILLDNSGRAVLTDFDLARAEGSTQGTRTGALGTFVYAAPEQLRDASRVDASADIYSIGLTVLFVLGKRDPPALVARVEPEYFDELEWGAELRQAVEKAVAYRAEDRTITCRKLVEAIAAELTKPPAVVAPRRIETPASVVSAPPRRPSPTVAEPAPAVVPARAREPVAASTESKTREDRRAGESKTRADRRAVVQVTAAPRSPRWPWYLGLGAPVVAGGVYLYVVSAGPTDKEACEHVIGLMEKELGEGTSARPSSEELQKFVEECQKDVAKQREKVGDQAFDEQVACVMASTSMDELAKCEKSD